MKSKNFASTLFSTLCAVAAVQGCAKNTEPGAALASDNQSAPLASPTPEQLKALGLDAEEYAFFAQVKALQDKFPEMKSRFGLWKVHSHFEQSADEVLHETSDKDGRVSTTKVVKKSELPANAFVASWTLEDKSTPAGGPIAKPDRWCCD